MELCFNINYNTNFGEELALNIIDGTPAGSTRKYKMATADGKLWTCAIGNAGSLPATIDYYYSVEHDGHELRHEWLVAPHRLELTPENNHTIYDNWRDLPADAHLYSSAITDCVAAREAVAVGKHHPARGIVLRVKAPQLDGKQRLLLVGNDPSLGAWDAASGLPMTEHSPNEWVAVIDADRLFLHDVEYKFVAAATDNGRQAFTWEGGGNRSLPHAAIAKGTTVALEVPQARMAAKEWRIAGTVIPVFSLRSEGSFGVGDFGDLRLMVDWAAQTGQRAIQLLPINDTGITHTWTDSYPYNSISIYALHPQYTDLRQLPPLKDTARRDHYERLRRELNALPQIDYERVNNAKLDYLHELYAEQGNSMTGSEAFTRFFEANKQWLVPYAAFCHYRDLYGTATFGEWPAHRHLDDSERQAMADPASDSYKEVAFWYFVQYNLYTQMRAAHDYARSRHIILKGDIPIGISRDGVEAWVEPRYFNQNGQAGAPPDAFSANGQNWGFPTYNWDEMLADGCSWWVRRFRNMAEYFDAFRIDHVLGFFRIWEIPIDAVHGLLGQFSPSLAMSRSEIESYGLHFQEELFTTPFITDWVLDRIFRERAEEVKAGYLERHGDRYRLLPQYATQRKVEAAFRGKTSDGDVWLRDGLYALISDVLFVRDRKDRNLFHPRIGVQLDFIYESLWDCDKQAFNRLYNDYYYRRNSRFWYGEAMKKLPRLTEATRMLACAEDLGMVPECVPWVMSELRILSLEIQSMPKDDSLRFGVLERNPYLSVCTISTHDMPTLRQWWDEDWARTQDFYNNALGHGGPAPHPLPGWLAEDIVCRNLASPSLLCLLSLQDWLSIDEDIRLTDANAERINVPANPRHYWRYRMHLTLEELMAADDFNAKVSAMIAGSGRK